MEAFFCKFAILNILPNKFGVVGDRLELNALN
jgi:hypothetical protein